MRAIFDRRTALLLLALGAAALPLDAQHGPPTPGTGRTGVLHREAGAYEGFTLLAPLQSTTTYLLDMAGQVAHRWESEHRPGQSVYLLANGHLLRTARDPANRTFRAGGEGGLIEELAWDSTGVWRYAYGGRNRLQHHDIEPLPNGNVLLIAWELRTREQALAAGRDPKFLEADELWPDHVVEIAPVLPDGGRVVWEWHVWDHLVQDRDPEKPSFGVVADHPELVDVNAGAWRIRSTHLERRERAEALRRLGYADGSSGTGSDSAATSQADWNHTNSVDYNAALDQIVLSVHALNEIWVIDHGTTTAEAAGHEGGRWGKGGDLLYRWGNPRAYGKGTAEDQRLFSQHDARWIRAGNGGWSILVFNNGLDRPDGEYSSVELIPLPFDAARGYALGANGTYGPDSAAWTYTAPRRGSFFSGHVSGAQLLPNGNTLICSGAQGHLFEITSRGEKVWEYVLPFGELSSGATTSTEPSGLFRATRLSPNHPGLASLGK